MARTTDRDRQKNRRRTRRARAAEARDKRNKRLTLATMEATLVWNGAKRVS